MCSACQEAVSARLDGEDEAGEGAAVDAHLAGCEDCRRWADRAAAVTRLARTRQVEPHPDLVETILAAASAPPRRRRVWTSRRAETALRALLAASGLGQLWLAIGGIVAAAGRGAHGGTELGGANLEHLTHESAAWNLALAVGFFWVAARGRRAAGLVPLVGAFVAVLTALSLPDLLAGEVRWSREASHAVTMLGLLLLIALGRMADRPGEGSPAAVRASSGEAGEPGASPHLRRVPGLPRQGGDQDLEPTGGYRAA